jgi:hypothetical protein
LRRNADKSYVELRMMERLRKISRYIYLGLIGKKT